MPKNKVLKVIDAQRGMSSAGAFFSSSGGGGGSVDLSPYMKLDGSTPMAAGFNMGGWHIYNVSTVDGVDISDHASNIDGHHNKIHALNGTDHTGYLDWLKLDFTSSNITNIVLRAHNNLQGIGPNDHHNQVHSITGADHTISGTQYDVVGVVSGSTTLGLLTPSFSPGAAAALLRSDTSGTLTLPTFIGSTKVRTPLIDTASSINLSLSPAANLLISPGSKLTQFASGGYMQSNAFLSGFTGYGWRIEDGIGTTGVSAIETTNLTVRGLLRVYEMFISKIRIGNGSFLFTDGGKVTSVTGSGPYTLTFDEACGFAINDLIKAQKFLGTSYVSNCTVTAVAGDGLSCTVTLNSGNAPAAGYEYARIGNTSDANRRGSVYVTSNDSNAPYLDVIDGIAAHSDWGTNSKVKVRLGKLYGINNSWGYGLFAGTGTADNNQYVRVDSAGIRLNNVPIQMYNGGTQTFNLSAWNNFWIGPSSSDKRIYWNGSKLSLVGDLKISYDANNYFEINSDLMQIRGVGGGNVQWYVNASDGMMRTGYNGGIVFWYMGMAIEANAYNAINFYKPGGSYSNEVFSSISPSWSTYGRYLSFNIGNGGSYTKDTKMSFLLLSDEKVTHSLEMVSYFPAYTIGSTSYHPQIRNLITLGYEPGIVDEGTWTWEYIPYGGSWSPILVIKTTGLTSYKQFEVNNNFAVSGASSAFYLHSRTGAYGSWALYNNNGDLGFYQNYLGATTLSITRNGGALFYTNVEKAAEWSVASNASNYGFMDFNYAGVRRGFLYWNTSFIALYGDNNMHVVLVPTGTGKVGIKTGSPAYDFDVYGEAHVSGAIRSDTAFSLYPVSTPATSGTYYVMYVDSADGKLKYKTTGGTIRTISYT